MATNVLGGLSIPLNDPSSLVSQTAQNEAAVTYRSFEGIDSHAARFDTRFEVAYCISIAM